MCEEEEFDLNSPKLNKSCAKAVHKILDLVEDQGYNSSDGNACVHRILNCLEKRIGEARTITRRTNQYKLIRDYLSNFVL